MTMKKLLLLTLATMLAACGEPTTRTALVTCSNFADCQSKIAAAASGDTIHILPGSYDWTAQITISKPITIYGDSSNTIDYNNNSMTVNDQTKLVDKMPRDKNRFFQVDKVPGKVEIRNLTFTGEGGGVNGSAPFITCGNSVGTTTFNLHHNHFTKIDAYGYYIYSGCTGASHHNVTDNPPSQKMQNGMWNGDNPYGDIVFSKPAGYGPDELNDDWFFIEDCYIDNRNNGDNNAGGGFDAKRGAKFVIRRCVLANVEILCHGTEEQRQRGGRAQDIYENHYIWTYGGGGGLDGIRSGTAQYHDNVFYGPAKSGWGLQTYRVFASQFGSPWYNADGTNAWDKNDPQGIFDQGTTTGGSNSQLVDTSKNWPANKWIGYAVKRNSDGKMSLITGNTNNTLQLFGYTYSATWASGQAYAIRKVVQPVDLVGYGQGDLLTGDNPTPRWLNQNTPEGVYEWNNKAVDGSFSVHFQVSAAAQPWQKKGVTYFEDTPRPGYVAPAYPHPLAGGSPQPTGTPAPTATASPTPAPTGTPIPVPTATPTLPPTATPNPTATATPTATVSASPTPSASPSPSPSVTPAQIILQPGQGVYIQAAPTP